jgi:hypothetical protein
MGTTCGSGCVALETGLALQTLSFHACELDLALRGVLKLAIEVSDTPMSDEQWLGAELSPGL